MDKKSFTNLTARVPEDVCAFLDEVHWQYKNSRAGLARIAIVEWCQAHGFDEWAAARRPQSPDPDSE